MVRVAIVGLALMAAGCSENEQKKLWTHDEILDIASDAASDTSELEAKVSSLESDLSDAQTEIAEAKTEIAQLRADLEQYESDSVEWHHKHNY